MRLPIRVAMEGYNGWARPLDQQVLARGWRLYNVNNLKLARYKEIFPAPTKSDAIDSRRMLELFGFDEQRPLGRDVLQEMTTSTTTQRELRYLTRRRRQQVAAHSFCQSRPRLAISGSKPDPVPGLLITSLSLSLGASQLVKLYVLHMHADRTVLS